MKILYACGNTSTAKIQCERFLKNILNKKYIIKISAYKNFLPNCSIDWTLDALLNIYDQTKISITDNDNFEIYYNQVKSFNPDLIIADMEIFSTHIGNVLNIPIWQCSSSLINHATSFEEKKTLKLYSNYKFYYANLRQEVNRRKYIIDISSKRLVYSHFSDLENPPILMNNFEWIRPYHDIGKLSINNQYSLVCGLSNNNKKIFDLLTRYSESICFTDYYNEKYNNLILKNIDKIDEYYDYIINSSIFITEGQTSFLADAFYNEKYCLAIPNFKNPECITNAMYSEHFNLSTTIFDSKIDIQKFLDKKITKKYNKDVMYLHQKIEKEYE